MDDFIVFHRLSETHLSKIADLLIKKLSERLLSRSFAIEVDDKVRDKIVADGYTPMYGARPLKREIEKQIENPLSLKIISGEFVRDDKIQVFMKNGAIEFKKG